MFKTLIRSVSGAFLAASVAAAPVCAADKLKIGFIYPSPVGDVGWASELDRGKKAVLEKFGDKVEAITVENIPEGPDVARILNQMAANGAKMIVLGSFGYMNDGLKLARRRPDIAFIHASGYRVAANFGNFQTRNYETSYLAGLAAGFVTKSKTLGIVASYPIPEVVGMLNAFTLGAQKTNPDVSIKVVWLNSWFDPNKSQEAARSLVAQSSDVLFSLYQDTPEVVSLAEKLGVYVVNTSSDMKKYAPKHLLASLQISWVPHFVDQVEKVLAGSFKGTAYWGGLKDDAVRLASLSDDLTAEQKQTIEEATAAIKAGTFHPLTGPIVAQDGTRKLDPGQTISDSDLLAINWLVKGVETKIPN